MQLEVMNSPFNQDQVELLNRLLPNLTETQQIWLNGYLSALHRSAYATSTAVALQEAPTATAPLAQASVRAIPKEATILYGSQTGNSQMLAGQLSKKLEEKDFKVTLSAMSDFKTNGLKSVRNLFIVVSTHGEGDPPDNGLTFHEFLHGRRAPQFEDLNFSVLALGDSSYEFFCKTGQDFDERLEALGGKRLAPRVDCDLDFDEPAALWIDSVLKGLDDLAPTAESGSASSFEPLGVELLAEQAAYSRTNPYVAEVFENINLNGRGSKRETRHLELSLEGSNLTFEPGDAIGIYPENDPVLVDALIEQLGFQAEERVPMNTKGEQCPLRQALLHHYEITVLTKPLLEKATKFSTHADLQQLLAAGAEQKLREYIMERDLLDLVRDFAPWEITATELVTMLRKLPARLYSIASSQKANPEEVHLTIRTVRYEAHGRDRKGVCSTQCAERVQAGDTLPIYVQHNPNFKLPADPEQPIIMIGPGTGIAPFRSFLEEREEIGATGKSWLFFGDQHFLTDFLYQTDFQRWLKEGVLTRMDIAFSRDTDKKVYVQHRMQEKSRELFQWLEEGAIVYVCGDEKHMAHDVHQTLCTIIEQEGGLTAEEATAYLANMQQEKRYQRDVY